MQDHRHARLVINKAEERAGRRGRWYLPNKQGVLTVCMGDLADATIVIGILAQVFFLEYYGLGRYLNWVITGMICVRALFSGWKYSGRALLLGLITVAGWLSGALLGGNMETFRRIFCCSSTRLSIRFTSFFWSLTRGIFFLDSLMQVFRSSTPYCFSIWRSCLSSTLPMG